MRDTIRERVYERVDAERERQEDKWGRQEHGPLRWQGIIGEEYGEMVKEAIEIDFALPGAPLDEMYHRYETEMIQMIAVAVNALEQRERDRRERETLESQ